jgi:hypothetical protein
MNHNEPHNLSEKIAWAKARGAFSSRRGQSLYRLWELGITDPVTLNLIDAEIRPLLKLDKAGELPPFQASRLKSGEIGVGQDSFGGWVRWYSRWLTEGTLGISSIGGGKTTWLLWVAMQLAFLPCNIWLSESYKKHLRRLYWPLHRAGIALVILRPCRWKLNPLQADHVDPQVHFARARDLLARRLDAGVRGAIYLGESLYRLYQRFGIWNGQREIWPTLFDLCEDLRSAIGLHPAARDAILDRLIAFCVSVTPQAAAYRKAWKPSDLARFNSVIEFDGVSQTVRQVIQESLIFSVFQREVDLGVSNGPLKLFIAFDDSQMLFDVSAQSTPGITPLDELAGIIRGMGIAFCVLPQSTVGLSPRLQTNLNNKFMGRLGCAEDYNRLGADMGLSSEQLHWAQLHLQPGWFVGQVGSGDYRKPFLFHSPKLAPLDAVTDLEADQSVAVLDHLPTVFASEFAHWQPYPLMEVTKTESTTVPELTEPELKFIEIVVKTRGKSMSFYARKAAMNGRRAAEIRQRLIKMGFLREHELAAKSRGRPSIVLEPLPPAFEALAARGKGAQS